jgi:hypothetical protein
VAGGAHDFEQFVGDDVAWRAEAARANSDHALTELEWGLDLLALLFARKTNQIVPVIESVIAELVPG